MNLTSPRRDRYDVNCTSLSSTIAHVWEYSVLMVESYSVPDAMVAYFLASAVCLFLACLHITCPMYTCTVGIHLYQSARQETRKKRSISSKW